MNIIALARRYGADLIEQNTDGYCVLQNDKGEISLFPYGEIPKVCILHPFIRGVQCSSLLTRVSFLQVR